MRPLVLLPLLLAACQEFDVADEKPEVPEEEPIDSDVPVEVPPGAADIEVEPMEIDFGYLPQNCPAVDQKVTIKNVGEEVLHISEVLLDGPDASVFRLEVTPRDLAPGEQFKATIGFTATALFEYERVRLKITSDDPDEDITKVDLFGAGAEDALHEQSWAQIEHQQAVDVLFVIDNSGSMEDEVNDLANAFGTFINQFLAFGLDFHIAVTTTDMSGTGAQGKFVGPVITNQTANPTQQFKSQTTQGFAGSGDEMGLAAAQAALTPPLSNNANAGFIRADANLAIAVISDENDFSSLGAPSFSNWLDGMKVDPDHTSFSGMVGPETGGLIAACPPGSVSDASAAPKYHDAIDRTGGVWSDICDMEVNPFLTFLAKKAAGLLTEFPLDFVPSSPAGITVWVDGVEVPWGLPNGWLYDDRHNTIDLNGTAVPDPGAVITVQYPYITSCP